MRVQPSFVSWAGYAPINVLHQRLLLLWQHVPALRENKEKKKMMDKELEKLRQQAFLAEVKYERRQEEKKRKKRSEEAARKKKASSLNGPLFAIDTRGLRLLLLLYSADLALEKERKPVPC